MRLILVLSALALAGCAGGYVEKSGKYDSLADYLVKEIPALERDVIAAGGTHTDALCVAEQFGWRAYGSDYTKLEQAVTGQRVLTSEEYHFIESRTAAAVRVKNDAGQVVAFKNAFDICMKTG